ncbi:MAG: hypothetical protein ACSHXF_08670 [Aquaticitalea sp.]
MRKYESFEEIEYELQRLQIERQIGLEKLKIKKSEFIDGFKPLNWVTSAAKFAGKYGVFMLVKKMFKNND